MVIFDAYMNWYDGFEKVHEFLGLIPHGKAVTLRVSIPAKEKDFYLPISPVVGM